jgi:hypothetical protein
MSDEFNVVPEEEPVPQPVEEVSGEELVGDVGLFEDEDDIFDEGDDFAHLLIPEHCITLRTTSGEVRYVETEEPMTVVAALEKVNLRINGDLKAFFNGAEVSLTSVIPVDGSVMLIGTVKGG